MLRPTPIGRCCPAASRTTLRRWFGRHSPAGPPWIGLAAVLLGVAPIAVTTADAAGAAPTVNAGADQVISRADRAFLDGQVTDDGLPEASRLAVTWSVVSGPGPVTIAAPVEAHTSATFGATGSYVLRLHVK